MCTSLNFVTLPSSLKWIEVAAFAEYPALNSVYFFETVAEWNAITIEINNESLTNATIIITPILSQLTRHAIIDTMLMELKLPGPYNNPTTKRTSPRVWSFFCHLF